MSFQTVSDRLKDLQASNEQLRELINRLATINFQPGSIPLGDNDEDNVIVELTSEVQQTIKEQDEEFELLLEEVLDLDAGREGSESKQQQKELEAQVRKAMKELNTCLMAFRKAQLSARRSLEAAQRAERDLLLQSYSEPRSSTSSPGLNPLPPRRRPQQNIALTEEEKAINASSDVTRALRRTHDMMAAELAKSQFAHETLKQSTEALAQLSETYSVLDTLLSSSKNLLGTLLRSQKSDTWYLETAFYVLSATIGWLVFRRFFYWPLSWIWWFFSFPLRMFFRGLVGIFAAMGLTGRPNSEAQLAPGMGSVVSQVVAHNSGTRGLRPSLGPPGQSINVGGGGRGAPMRSSDTPEASGESISEQVGRIVDESREQTEQGEQLREAENEIQSDSQPNPKKRMWEEDKEEVKEPARKRDEL